MIRVALVGLLGGAALATREPEPYDRELGRRFGAELAEMNAGGRFEEAVEAGRRVEKRLGETAPVAYEVAFALNRLGRVREALDAYDRAVALDPADAAARYDRGELLLSRGEDDRARADFMEAARLRPDHWAAFFRLAQLAGRAGDADGFERHLTEALRQGFDFRTIEGDPEWKVWSRDPLLGPVLARLIVVYSDEGILERMRGR